MLTVASVDTVCMWSTYIHVDKTLIYKKYTDGHSNRNSLFVNPNTFISLIFFYYEVFLILLNVS